MPIDLCTVYGCSGAAMAELRLQQRSYGPQSLKHVLFAPLQKKLANPGGVDFIDDYRP